jgi:XTP/dITP diphosphohydrolase
MPLLVVPLATEQSGVLTIQEWDLLCSCSRVYFEAADHPLIERLAAAGISCGPFDDEPSANDDGCALVADPSSTRVVELALDGATVTAGPAVPPDSLSAAQGASVARRASASLTTLAVVMARLRSEDGCPWDQEQSHSSLSAHLLEETYEVLDAIARGDIETGLQEELGDVLLQVAFHSRIAQQDGRFDLAEVADSLVAKLVHRHPHVFGAVEVAGAQEVIENWEAIKRAEKTRDDPWDDIPKSLPALLAAFKTQKRAAALGWHPSPEEAAHELDAAIKTGDVGQALFWLVAVARAEGIEPETALRTATASFRRSLQPDSDDFSP